MRFVSQLAFVSLWCFVFALPWDEVTKLPILGSIPRIVGLVASTVGAVYVLAYRRIRRLSWFHVFAVFFVLWVGVSNFWSIDPDETRQRFITCLQLAVLAWLIWEIGWTPERRHALLQAYVLGACVAATATVRNYATGFALKLNPEGEGMRFVALGQDPNELGVILALGIPMAWYLGRGLPGRTGAWLWRLYVPFGLSAILLTASRGAFVAAVVALLFIPWTAGRAGGWTKAALYMLAAVSLAVAISFVPEASLERIQTMRAEIGSGYFGGRGPIWQAGFEVAKAHPLIGVGAGGFNAAVAPALPKEMGPHQTFLGIQVELGLVGLVLFLAMLAAAIQPLRHLPTPERRLWIVLLGTLAIGSLTLHLGHRKYVWFVLGLAAAQVALSPQRRPSWAVEPSS